MSIFNFLRLIFIVLAIIGISFTIPIITAAVSQEFSVIPSFLIPMVVSIILGIIFYVLGKNKKLRFSTRSVFFFVASAWISISIFGALPLVLSGTIPDFINALFESVSGFSTTGATILTEVENLPRSINLWRCQMHWLGGMGVIALTVALLPLLGVSGFNLIKAESTGPDKGKITPKMANTAKMLWILYGSLTLLHIIALKLCGMDWIDSISHGFSTLGTGGFSTQNSSIASYNSVAIETVVTVFMFLAGINFSMYFYAISGKFREIKENTELKIYLLMFFIAIFIITLILTPFYGTIGKALRYASFQVASIITTSGYATTDYLLWPQAAQFFIFLLFFTGACSGSTAGGFKIIRWIILGKQAHNEMLRMLHPHEVFSVRLNGKSGRKDLVFSVASFTFVYLILVMVTTMLGTFSGLDILTSFTGSLSMIGNIGPAFGELGPTANYSFLSPFLKCWYCFAMIAGRLELYNLIIFILPDYWRK